ncbi:septal ring lytic transglycosylase RlpA family protein [Sphingomonas gilva]|nr:SPOR domain-containing protein [Sphingomonas gilva]
MAGWYGAELAGRPTASGERFDPSGMTAAHRTLPLGSHVEVTSIANGRNVVLRINDRGPYHGKRIIDLSRAAAQRLGISGIGRVRVRSVDSGYARQALPQAPALAGTAAGPGPFRIQVASFHDEDRARALARRIDGEADRAGALWRVTLGPFKDARSANAARAEIAADGFGDAVIQPVP